jgi:hypothetical protein
VTVFEAMNKVTDSELTSISANRADEGEAGIEYD